jgi:hypothetical protein
VISDRGQPPTTRNHRRHTHQNPSILITDT